LPAKWIGLQCVSLPALAPPQHASDAPIVHAEGVVDQCLLELQQRHGHQCMTPRVAEQSG